MQDSVSAKVSSLLVAFAIISLISCGGSPSPSSDGQSGSGSSGVTINAYPSQIGAGANWEFTASVTGVSSSAVNWSVTPSTGAGTIDSNGLYIAPTSGTFPMSVTVAATSQSSSSLTGTASISVTQNDPLGSAQSTQITCPTFGGGLTGSTCYQLNISCPGTADFSAYLKVNASSSPVGTVIFGTGTGGSALYDFDQPDFFSGSTNGGLAVVQSVLNANFTTVQVSFGSPFNSNTPNGWLTGPGGVRRLACRYATVAQWVYQNIHNANASAPMCATGNSGGAGAIAYALTNYGLGSGQSPVLSMVEETSGPPMSRLDQACVPPSNSVCAQQSFTCNPGDPVEGLSICYSTDESQIIDPAYSQPLCTNAINGSTPPSGLFLSDSILGGPAPTFSKTNVVVLFGGQDQSSAVEQGLAWYNNVTTMKSQACVSDAPHPIPQVQDGASTIANDIQNFCRLQ